MNVELRFYRNKSLLAKIQNPEVIPVATGNDYYTHQDTDGKEYDLLVVDRFIRYGKTIGDTTIIDCIVS